MKEFIKKRYALKYDIKNFEKYYKEYQNIKPFKVNENIYETNQTISDEAHYILRLTATYKMKEVLESLKIDLEDANVYENIEQGNIGTFGRIAKMFTGSYPEDNYELMSGRWNKAPRMAVFPNDKDNHNPVFVKTDLNAVCSHHFIRFGEDYYDEDSFIVIGYIPEKYLGGISKINRFVNWCARRGWLQEDLTRYIGKKIEENFKTNSVYVGLFNMKHGCTAFRGACDNRAATTSIYSTGEFLTNPELIPPKYRG
jgi:GTP cyclohydrolase I